MSFNDDPRFSTTSLVAMTCWAVTGILLLLAWVGLIVGEGHLSHMVANTSCVMAAVSVVAQVRCYAAQVCRLVRITGGLERTEADVREFTGPRR